MDSIELNYILDLVRQNTGIDLSHDKSYLVDARLHPIAKDHNFSSVSELILHLRNSSPGVLHQAAVQAMLTHETFFFRDQNVYDALRHHILPQSIRHKSAERTLHIWSAACSTGQEAYSIVMSIEEYFPGLKGWDVRVYASDISLRILEKAREGIYSTMELNRGLSPALQAKYFSPKDDKWQIAHHLRRKVEFFPMNLTLDTWPHLPVMDIVFLRNVMIYFNAATKQGVLSRVRRNLYPESVLILGHSESVLHSDPLFEAVRHDRAVVYKLKSLPKATTKSVLGLTKSIVSAVA